MEDLPERSTTQPQSEEQPLQAIAAETKQAAEPQTPAPEAAGGAAAEPLETESAAPPTSEQAPVSTESPGLPAATAPTPSRPAKPTGPRLAELRPGSVVEGKVTRIERYGAFVDLGLVEKRDGLIHISELASYRVRRVEDVVHLGDEVRARVVSVDIGRGRIALSLNDVDAAEYGADAATTSSEPALTAMAAAFERAYGRLREKEGQQQPNGSRQNQGTRKRREQEMLMEKFRTSVK